MYRTAQGTLKCVDITDDWIVFLPNKVFTVYMFDDTSNSVDLSLTTKTNQVGRKWFNNSPFTFHLWNVTYQYTCAEFWCLSNALNKTHHSSQHVCIDLSHFTQKCSYWLWMHTFSLCCSSLNLALLLSNSSWPLSKFSLFLSSNVTGVTEIKDCKRD